MANRPNAQGSATIKHEGNWERLGGVVAWLTEGDCGGVITLDIEKMVELGARARNFWSWFLKCFDEIITLSLLEGLRLSRTQYRTPFFH